MKDITSFINNSKTFISNLNQKGVDVSLSHKSYIHSESNSSTFHILLQNDLFGIIKTKIFYSIRNLMSSFMIDILYPKTSKPLDIEQINYINWP